MPEATILSYGMGVESSALFVNWVRTPSVRPCPLQDLIVISAHTGGEYLDTATDIEQYILPLMREHGVRYVQVARAGHLEADGIVVLDDTREPNRLYVEGAYKLSEELRRMGTVVQVAGERRCSLKFKGWVIEEWLNANVRTAIARHAFGYNRDEMDRVEKCDAAFHERIAFGYNKDEQERVIRSAKYNTPVRTAFYPLVEWGWSRQDCLDYLERSLGWKAKKSACVYCPFTPLRDAALERHLQHPQQVAEALMLEHVSIAMNPRATLYRDRSLIQITEQSGNVAALRRYSEELRARPWAVYRVRRIYSAKGKADRAVERQATHPTAEQAQRELERLAAERGVGIETLRDCRYVFVERRTEGVYPCREEYFVTAPAVVEDKTRYGTEWFEAKWAALQMQLQFD